MSSINLNWLRGHTPGLPDAEQLSDCKIMLGIGAAILNHLPPTRTAGSLLLRSINLVSSSSSAVKAQTNNDRWNLFVGSTKVITLAIGMVGVISGHRLTETACVASDVGLQAIELGKALHEGHHGKALSHLVGIGMNAFTLKALLSKSKDLFLIAAGVNVIAFCAISAIKISAFANINKQFQAEQAPEKKTQLLQQQRRLLLEMLYYLTLGLGAYGNLCHAISKMRPPERTHFTVNNPTGRLMVIEGNRAPKQVIQPGGTAEFDIVHQGNSSQGFFKVASIHYYNTDGTPYKTLVRLGYALFHRPIDPKTIAAATLPHPTPFGHFFDITC